MPLKNIRGNLTIIVKIMVYEGVSDGGTDKIELKQEKANAATIIATIIIPIFNAFQSESKTIPIIKGKIEKRTPKKKEPQISPNTIVLIEIGHVISFSSVLSLVSQGNTIGAMEVEVKNIISDTNPDTTWGGSI